MQRLSQTPNIFLFIKSCQINLKVARLWTMAAVSSKLACCRAADTGNYKTFNNHQQSIMMTYSHRAKAYAYLKHTVCLRILPQQNTATYTTSSYSEHVHVLHPIPSSFIPAKHLRHKTLRQSSKASQQLILTNNITNLPSYSLTLVTSRVLMTSPGKLVQPCTPWRSTPNS